MPSLKIINYINENIPELDKLHIEIGGRLFAVTPYDKVNAAIVYNNILNGDKASIVIYHPKKDMLEAFLVLATGMAVYRDSIIKNSRFSINDYADGELVVFEGKLVYFHGTKVDDSDGRQKFAIRYEDKLNTRVLVPMHRFPEISKYSGARTLADPDESKRRRTDTRSIWEQLLGFKEEEIKLAGYPGFLVVYDKPILMEVLKNMTINGEPFFNLFPSVWCTATAETRLGRDSHQRAPIFYFVSNLSSADSVLSRQQNISGIYVAGKDAVTAGSSILSSITHGNQIEDIFLMQTYDCMDSLSKVTKGMGFRPWIWMPQDFESFRIVFDDQLVLDIETNSTGPSSYLLARQQTFIRAGRTVTGFMPIPYPVDFSEEEHAKLLGELSVIANFNKEYGSEELDRFCMLSYGLIIKLIQSPVPASMIIPGADALLTKTVPEHLKLLEELTANLDLLLPVEVSSRSKYITSVIKICVQRFWAFEGKINAIVEQLQLNRDHQTGIVVQKDYFMEPLKRALVEREVYSVPGDGAGEYFIVTDAERLPSSCQHVIWTYKPFIKEQYVLEPAFEHSTFICYPLHKLELESAFKRIEKQVSRSQTNSERAAILQIPTQFFEAENEVESPIHGADSIEVEQTLESIMRGIIYHPHQLDNMGHETVKARQVTFIGGAVGFFRAGTRIRVIDTETESVEQKTAGELQPGDKAVFLKDSKRTVFEELLAYFEHDSEVGGLIDAAELWRSALIRYCERENLSPAALAQRLNTQGLARKEHTVEGWLAGSTICPPEDDYKPVDIIALVTNDPELIGNIGKVKNAASRLRSLHIKVGRYLTNRISHPGMTPTESLGDAVLESKLNQVSEHAEIAEVLVVGEEAVEVDARITGRLLKVEDI